jgi:hypothetical protein
MEYAKEKYITESERIVDTCWENEILTVITITKETHLVYQLVIMYDDIDEKYCKLEACSGYMFTSKY